MPLAWAQHMQLAAANTAMARAASPALAAMTAAAAAPAAVLPMGFLAPPLAHGVQAIGAQAAMQQRGTAHAILRQPASQPLAPQQRAAAVAPLPAPAAESSWREPSCLSQPEPQLNLLLGTQQEESPSPAAAHRQPTSPGEPPRDQACPAFCHMCLRGKGYAGRLGGTQCGMCRNSRAPNSLTYCAWMQARPSLMWTRLRWQKSWRS